MHHFKLLKKISRIHLLYLSLLFLSHISAHASWSIMPESHHQLYDSWGLFFDEQSTLINYGQARLWTALGGTMPVLGDMESPHHPELVFHASANASLYYNDNFRIWTETLDARIGLSIEWELNQNLRFSVGYEHFSGHSADGVRAGDMDLFELTLGQEFFPIRAVYDIDRNFRISGTLSAVAKSTPLVKPLWLDQSFEFFPWGGLDDSHHPSPYISLGLSETGADQYLFTYHIQLGIYCGNHFSKMHRQTIRGVVGYYNGADPRLKVFEFRNAAMRFAYLGLMFDL